MTHQLPDLPYAVNALEPHLDARTLTLHHDVHHAAYITALNKALESAPDRMQQESAGWLLLNLHRVPEAIRTEVCNNAGGHINHSLFWRAMRPPNGDAMPDLLVEAIDDSFGSLDKFKAQFEEAGRALFGSGWVWLVKPVEGGGKLQVLTTNGHGHPRALGYAPVLLNDVWEHAYYLKHESRRDDYLKNWWLLTDWHEAARRLARVQHPDERFTDVDVHDAAESPWRLPGEPPRPSV